MGDVVMFDIAEGVRANPRHARRSTARAIPAPTPTRRSTARSACHRRRSRKPSMSRDDLLSIVSGHGQVGAGIEIRATPSSSASPTRLTPWCGRCRASTCAKEVVMAGVLGPRFRFFLAGNSTSDRRRHRVRARRPRRHHGAADQIFHRRRHPLPDLVKMGWTSQARIDKSTAPATAAPDRQPAEDRFGVLCRQLAIAMAEATCAKKRVLPCAWLNGEYTPEGHLCRRAVVIGSRGV